MSADVLDVGDIVEVYAEGRIITFLRVDETTSAISKLAKVVNFPEFETNIDFKNIQIGNTIVKSKKLDK